MKNKFYLFVCISLILVFFLSGCLDSTNNVTNDVNVEGETAIVEKIEVYHFHSNRQCSTCETIGANLDETIERYFLDDFNSGKIVYGHINIENPENSEITNRYGAQGTSLWLGIYDNNGFHAEDDLGIWYRINDKEEFIRYLKDLIEKRLSGDMD